MSELKSAEEFNCLIHVVSTAENFAEMSERLVSSQSYIESGHWLAKTNTNTINDMVMRGDEQEALDFGNSPSSDARPL